MNTKIYPILTLTFILLISINLTNSYTTTSENYSSKVVIISSGGTKLSSTYTSETAVSQTAIGKTFGNNYTTYLGFFYAAAVNRKPYIVEAYVTDIVDAGQDVKFDVSYIDKDNDLATLFVCRDSGCENCNINIQNNCYCYDLTYKASPLTCNYTTQQQDPWQNYYWVQVYDGKLYSDIVPGTDEYFNVNHAPNITQPTIYPSNPTTLDQLNCSAIPTDPEQTILNISFTWYKNSTSIYDYDTNVSCQNGTICYTSVLVPSTALNKGDVWICSARSYDSRLYSEWRNSTPVTIGNTPPSTPQLIKPTNGNYSLFNRTPTFIWNSSTDPDGDTITYELNITNAVCPDIFIANITKTNYTVTVELCTSDETNENPYFWQVRAYDGIDYSNWSVLWNFSIKPTIILTFVNDLVNFGERALGEIVDTTDDTDPTTPAPFLLRNDGNVFADIINISATSELWIREYAHMPSKYFQFKVDNSSEPNSFNWSASLTWWMNVSATNRTIISALNYSDASDEAELEIKIEVPGDEPPGLKETSLIVYGAQT